MTGKFKGRINLSPKASEALLFMVGQLKKENPHLPVNPSKLCSWIVENYVRDHFEVDMKKIIGAHFNPRRYLTEMLKKAKTVDEMRDLFKSAEIHLEGKSLAPPKRRSPRAAVRATEAAATVHDHRVGPERNLTSHI